MGSSRQTRKQAVAQEGANAPHSASPAAGAQFNPPSSTKSSAHTDAYHHLWHSHNTAPASRPSQVFPLRLQQWDKDLKILLPHTPPPTFPLPSSQQPPALDNH